MDYTKLHTKLAKQSGLTESQIVSIRSAIIGRNLTHEELLQSCIAKMSMKHRNSGSKINGKRKKVPSGRRHPKAHYQALIDFLYDNEDIEYLLEPLNEQTK